MKLIYNIDYGVTHAKNHVKAYLAGALASVLTVGGIALVPVFAVIPILADGSFAEGSDPGVYTTVVAGDPSIPN